MSKLTLHPYLQNKFEISIFNYYISISLTQYEFHVLYYSFVNIRDNPTKKQVSQFISTKHTSCVYKLLFAWMVLNDMLTR